MTSAPVIDQAGELRSARVESLRAIGALGVVVGHAFALTHYYDPGIDDGFINRALLGGQAGAYLLSFLSGYLLFWPFAQRYLGRGDCINLRRYAINRALRLFPLYYAVLVILLVFQEQGGTLKPPLGNTAQEQGAARDRPGAQGARVRNPGGQGESRQRGYGQGPGSRRRTR